MSAESVALEHYRARRQLVDDVAAAAEEAWRQVVAADLVASWRAASGPLLIGLAGAQLTAARAADGYLDTVLAEQDIDPAAEGELNPRSLAGVASDGRSLATLLEQPMIATLLAIGGGATVPNALATGYASLDMIVRTQVADAGRTADQVALTARTRAGGYTRMAVGRTCSRCIILAGRWYAANAGFKRHPRCLPAGVRVSVPGVEAATRRWFEGELVILRTAGGEHLPVTGNHPVLTDRGWIPANLIQEGDHVARGINGHAVPLAGRPEVRPDEDQVPTLVEDYWRALRVRGVHRVPGSPQDFHGDGGYSQVDVVSANGFLQGRHFAEFPHPFSELPFPVGNGAVERVLCGGGFSGQRTADELRFVSDYPRQALAEPLAALRASAAFGGRRHSPRSGLIGLLPHPQARGGANVTKCDTCPPEADFYGSASNAVLAGDIASTVAALVGGDDLGDRERPLLERWDAPAVPFSVESRPAYAQVGRDLLNRLSGQIALDRVVEARRISWSGHVYNLSSVEGWYLADNIILSNCDCVHIPSREALAGDVQLDPRKTFDAMTRTQQDEVFTIAGAQAIRDGADPAKVVNARRGMYAAGDKLFTREAAGRRPRLMPEQIYLEARGNRAEALRLLRLHGYLR